MMIVCMTRPILYEQRSQWGGGLHHHQRLDLKPLSKHFSRRLFQEILKKAPKIPDKLGTLIIDTAEGNPFYIEELIKMLIEDGVISRRGELALDTLTNLRVPTTLTGVLQARLDALSERQKRLLQRASVIGRLFWDQAVTRLVADDNDRMSRHELQALLENAIHRELIFERERSNISESRAFVFKHALLRDVAYETVLLKRRRIYHRQAAE
jgi:predicted ATPase